jgi:hypothetical protein
MAAAGRGPTSFRPPRVRRLTRSLPMETHRGRSLGLIEFGLAVTRSVIASAAPGDDPAGLVAA